MRIAWPLAAGSFLATSLASPARADEAPHDSDFACQRKREGVACDKDGAPGRCSFVACPFYDFSESWPPTVHEVQCLRCRPKEPAPPRPAPAPPKVQAGCGACQLAPGGGSPLLFLLLLAARRAARRARR